LHRHDDDAARLADLVLAYVKDRLELDPVPLDHTSTAEELDALAPSLISEHGNDPEVVMEQFAQVLAQRVISIDSPRYLSFIPAAPTKAALLFDAAVSAASLNGTSWLEASGAIYAENQVLSFLAELAGLPESAGGCFVSGGSAANLAALTVARDRCRRKLGERRRVRFISSDQAHSSVTSTAHILDVEVETVPTEFGRMSGDAVAQFIATDDEPETIAAVVATAGTTNAGFIDDLDGIATAAASIQTWFHVDGAYGAAALLAPSVRDRFSGIEQADSLVVDPHKWLFAPFDCAALIYRDPALARSVHAQNASYLDPIHPVPGEGDRIDWNPTDYAYHLTRRPRGLPTWFSLAVHGVGAYREAIERVLAVTRAAAARIEASDHLELIAEPELSVVMFTRVGWTQQDYDRWSEELLDDGIAFVLPSAWDGEPILRLAFLNPETTLDMVDEILSSLD
jgi:aromatic-L-amino-acid decarboxylase